MRIRKPPYGKHLAPIGPGAVMQRDEKIAVTNPSFPAIPVATTELSSDMASQDLRPTLIGVAPTSILRVRAEFTVEAAASWAAEGLLTVGLFLETSLGFAFQLGGTRVTIFENVEEADDNNVMLHTVRVEGETLVSDITNPLLSDTYTARVTTAASAEGLSLVTYEGQVTVTMVEQLAAGESEDTRRPSAGPFRATRGSGAVLQEDYIQRPTGSAALAVVAAYTEVDGLVAEDMRPALVPFRRSSVMAVESQLVVISTGTWEGNSVNVRHELSIDDGASWEVVGTTEPVIEPSETGGVYNALRTLLPYRTETSLLDTFPAYDGEEVIARVLVNSGNSSAADADIVNEDSGPGSAVYVRLQELKA